MFPGKVPSNGVLSRIELTTTQKVIGEVRTKFPSLGMITFKYQENVTYEELINIAQQRLQQGYQMVVANRGEDHFSTRRTGGLFSDPKKSPPQKISR